MAQTIQFFVDDTSPSIFYSPFGDTLSTPDISAGWNPYFDRSGFASPLGSIGTGTSYHVTGNNGSFLSIKWKGTGIQLLGNATNVEYSILLDGQDLRTKNDNPDRNILATLQGLSNVDHTVKLTTQIPTSGDSDQVPLLAFDKALAISTAPLDALPPNMTYVSKIVNNSDISFFGQWSFQDNSPSNSFYRSVRTGDHAQLAFFGTTFFLRGTTSPQAGKFSIVLDNITTVLSSKSSFTNNDTLLYFASGLDPRMDHNVTITNEENSEFTLNANGFQIMTAGIEQQPSPSPTPTPLENLGTGTSVSKGTVAALVLAGVLASILIIFLLFFFLVLKPRARRRRLRREERRKAKEAGAVLDIAPTTTVDNPDIESTMADEGHRSSGRSGFARWKRDVEGGFTGLALGIKFRHSDSTEDRASRHNHDAEREPLSTKSSSFSLTSQRSKGKGKKKRKAHNTSNESWSPSITLELPIRPPSSASSYKEKDVGQSMPQDPQSAFSDLTSLSYISVGPNNNDTNGANDAAAAAAGMAPPSYTAPNRHRHKKSNSGPHSVPRSVSQSQPSSQPDRQQFASGNGNSNGNATSPSSGDPLGKAMQQADPQQTSLSPQSSASNQSNTREDRGSVGYSSDETSFLGPSATRNALRGLSPRTMDIQDAALRTRPRRSSLPLQTIPTPTTAAVVESSPEQARRAIASQSPSISYLSVGSLSPFAVDFPSGTVARQSQQQQQQQPQQQRRESQLSTSFVKFDDETDDIRSERRRSRLQDSRQESEPSVAAAAVIKPTAPPQRMRSQPQSNPPSSFHSQPHLSRHRADSTSFLDFSSSSDASILSFNSSDRERQWGSLMSQSQLVSRWSNTFSHSTELSRSGSSSIAPGPQSPAVTGPPTTGQHSTHTSESQSSNFPYPISLPTSLQFAYPAQMPSNRASSSIGHRLSDHVHPITTEIVDSPTDSVPVSTGDIQFRHSSSSDNLGHFQPSDVTFPSHPPPPGSPQGYVGRDASSPGLPLGGYIVQVALGQQPPVTTASTSSTFVPQRNQSRTPPSLP